MRRTRSYAKFLAFALAVSLAFQSAPAMAGKFNPTAEDSSGGTTVGQAGTGAVYGTVPDDDTSSIAIGNGSAAQKGDGTATADAIAVGIGMPEDHDRVVPFDDPKDFIANRFQVFHIFLTSKEKALSGL